MSSCAGCDLCGAESLDQAMRITDRVQSRAIYLAHQQILSVQKLQTLTGAPMPVPEAA
ncbi:MAG: hypothetical protein ABI475_01330 [Methylophilaceae bacterium]